MINKYFSTPSTQNYANSLLTKRFMKNGSLNRKFTQ